MEAKLFLTLFFALIVATLREFGINGCAEAAQDQSPPMIRFNVEDQHGRESHLVLCAGALVLAKTSQGHKGVVVTTRRCWDSILCNMGFVSENNFDPVVHAVMNPEKKYLVTRVVDTMPTPGTDPIMDEVAKQVVLMEISGPDEGIDEIPFLYAPNLHDVQGHELLVGTILFRTPLWLSLGTPAGPVGRIADSWDTPYFNLTGGNYPGRRDTGTPLYVKKNDHTRYLLGLRIDRHWAVNVRKLTSYITPTGLAGLTWRALEG